MGVCARAAEVQMWGMMLGLALANPINGALLGGGVSGDLITNPMVGTGAGLDLELGVTGGGERTGFRMSMNYVGDLTRVSGLPAQVRGGFGGLAGLILGARPT